MNNEETAQEKKDARKEAYADVKMYIANDWDLVEETPQFFLLKRSTASTTGHIIVFLLTFWFSFGLGNLIYYLSKKQKKKILK
jgi:hypothetical protein